jgi:hypothetical protein
MPIPLIERLVARQLVRRWCAKNPPTRTVEILRAQQRDLLALIDRLGGPADTRVATRVQIKRLPGLEASSTNYSLAMVAEHLARVNRSIAATVVSLSRGEKGTLSADPSLYKPDPGASAAAALADYDASIAAVGEALADTAAIEGSRVTHPHPWFGELSAATWACFPAFHGQIHAKQAGLIARGLIARGL